MKLHAWASMALVSGLLSVPAAFAIESAKSAEPGAALQHPSQRFHVNVPSVPLPAMALMATDVALVRIEGSRSEFPERGVASTVYRAQQLTSLKGLERSQVDIHVGGARDDSHWVVVEGAPTFAPGEEVLLFLWTDPSEGVTGVLGLQRGVYRLATNEAGQRIVFGDHANGEDIDLFLDRTAEAWLAALEIADAQQRAQEGK